MYSTHVLGYQHLKGLYNSDILIIYNILLNILFPFTFMYNTLVLGYEQVKGDICVIYNAHV
jgi:hypothetical protein